MQELNRQMMALPELRELEEIIRFGTGPAAVSGVSGVHRRSRRPDRGGVRDALCPRMAAARPRFCLPQL